MSFRVSLFRWKGINRYGESKQGIILAKNKIDATLEVNDMEIIVKQIVLVNKFLYLEKLKSQKTAILIRQLANILSSKISLKSGLEILLKNEKNSKVHEVLYILNNDIQSGISFSNSLKRFPKIFSSTLISMVEVGEGIGALDFILEKIAEYLEKKEETKNKIKKALTYPSVLICLILLMSIFLILFVVPEFTGLYKNFNQDLPVLTRIVIFISRNISLLLYFSLPLIIILSVSIGVLYKSNKKFMLLIHRLILSIPIIGNILNCIILARISEVLVLSHLANLTLVKSLGLASIVANNLIYVDAINAVKEKVMAGESFPDAMRSVRIFPEFILNMLSLGEDVGNIAVTLKSAAKYYENEAEITIHKYSNLLEPIIMSFLGLIIGILVLAMYYPILNLGTVV